MKFLARAVIVLTIGSAMPIASAADIESRKLDGAQAQQRLADTERLCAADPKSIDCMLAAVSVQSDLARALTIVSYADDRDRIRPLVRRVLDLAPPELQTSAAYALARLIPEPADTPRLVTLLNDPVPTVRRAAWGALKASPDPAAREWVARAQYQAKGTRFLDDLRPLDAAALQVQVPAGTAPVWFEMQCWRLGVQVFTADGDPGAVITHFSTIADQGSRPLAEVADWFEGDPARKALDRFANTAWFQSPYVIPLAFDPASGKPLRLAIVWHDVLLNRTGFALQWLPADTMPGSKTEPWSGLREIAVKLPEGAAPPPEPPVPFEKPGADKLDTDSYMGVVLADGAGADTYLTLFPNGAYRAEVEAIKTQPRLAPATVDMVEPSSVTIRFANLPVDQPVRLDVISHETLFSNAANDSAPQPLDPVAVPEGMANGEIVWSSDQQLKPGLYEIRAFFGKDEMEFDGLSMRRALPGDEATLFATIRILPRFVGVITDRAAYAPGETVNITYSDMPLPGSQNAYAPFVTLVKAGAPPADWQQYVYTKSAEGTASLQAPTAPGDYEVRVLFAQDGVIHGIADIKVDGAVTPVATPAPTPPPATPAPTPVPEDMNVVITLDKPSFAPGEAITGKVTGLSGDRDWITVVPTGSEDGTTGVWVYAEKGAKESAFTIPGQPAGAYEIRVRFRDQYRPVQRRLPFEVK